MNYYLYGVVVSSEIALYHLEPVDLQNNADVVVRYGDLDDEILKQLEQGRGCFMQDDYVWFSNQHGVFQIKDGREIVVSPKEGALERELASFILGWCIAFVFQQRNMLAIHCSAIAIEDKAVFISGYSGAGKSTTALSIIEKGYKYLADDIAMVGYSGDLTVHPAFPYQKICRNIAETMDGKDIMYVDELKDKFAYKNKDEFCNDTKTLQSIFILDIQDITEVHVEKLEGAQKFKELMNVLFLEPAYKSMYYPQTEVARCIKLSQQIEIYKITRPKIGDTVEQISNLIIDISKKEV